MQYDVFPPVRKECLTNEMNALICSAQDQSNSVIRQLNTQKKSVKGNLLLWAYSGAVFGIFAGFIACTEIAWNGGNGYLSAWVWYTVIGAVSGILIRKVLIMNRQKVNANLSDQIAQEQGRFEQQREEIRQQKGKEYADYINGFNQQVKTASVQFSNSIQANSVANYLSKTFNEIIDTADRSAYIERIEASFQFIVYKSCIKYFDIKNECQTIDFNKNRLNDLNGPVDQAALARVVSNNLQVNTNMAYPHDSSGTAIVIDVKENYTAEAVVMILTYIAPNGYYRASQKW